MKRMFVIAMFTLLFMVIPWILWVSEEKREINIAIIDKTVPEDHYREHLGLVWLLNHFNYSTSSGAFDKSTDYFGVKPNIEEQTYDEKPLPADYNDYDIIYIADTYGVFEDDVPWNNSERKGDRSDKIFGGLQEEEWKSIVDRVNSEVKSLLIGEFNSFASPTSELVREQMLDHFGLEWTGWVGRYFDELDFEKNIEIPEWLVQEFGSHWGYSGGGFILVNDFTYEMVVLEYEKHIEGEGISIAFTDEGKEKFEITSNVPYQYWFDIVVLKSTTTVYAQYEWALTDEGMKLLHTHHIPTSFAAVVSTTFRHNQSYYFAGDYNDIPKVPYFYQYKGMDVIYKWTNRFSTDEFYWSVYVPIMKQILSDFYESGQTEQQKEGDVTYFSRVYENEFQIKNGVDWVPFILKGVNMGMAKPGHFPGEGAIKEEEYFRWFEYIAEMNANVVRIYTLHPPGFYEALKRYNETHEEKIYIIQGVWIDEEPLESELDAFNKDITEDFQEEMKKIVDVIHGNAVIYPEVGHASGVYRSDVSEYVLGWILGIEWYPFMVHDTNETHKGMADFDGHFFMTKGAEPFEIWLAEQMEVITIYEMENYKTIRPISFTNWPTTDMLEHPSDSTENEDLVSIDPNVIYTKNEADNTGQFASYHVYPYYPDFLNYDQKYRTFVDHRGEYNNYAGYLNELNEAHRLPILIAEFGVPSSRGLTHENIFGWNQGFLTEEEQGLIVSRLFEDVLHEGMLGGLIFTWQDEWFKRTWNTMEYDNPNRRPYWSNAQTNEQQFGLLSFDRHKVKVDGDPSEWNVSALYDQPSEVFKSLSVEHDERYLYIHIQVKPNNDGYPIVLLDTVPNQGNHHINSINHIFFNNGVNFIVHLNPDQPQILIDDYYDLFTYQYGYRLKMIDVPEDEPLNNNGTFIPVHYALNKRVLQPRN